jgi:hypothetical protein
MTITQDLRRTNDALAICTSAHTAVMPSRIALHVREDGIERSELATWHRRVSHSVCIMGLRLAASSLFCSKVRSLPTVQVAATVF